MFLVDWYKVGVDQRCVFSAKVKSLEAFLSEANLDKVARKKDINIKTKLIMDIVKQLDT